MEFVVTVVGLLVFGWIYLAAQHAVVTYHLRKRHMECLWRLDDIVDVNFDTRSGEMMSAAIGEELQKI
jgi:hypothetical protein